MLARGYGLANVEHQVPATEHSMYQLASVTKQFTATAVMMLVEEGKLTLATPLRSVLGGMPPTWAEVTIAQLLTHTSGIPSYTSLPDFSRHVRKDYTPTELVDLVRDTPMDFAPGEKHRYNNTGYVLLGLIIEKLSGQGWGTFLAERIFRPTGMATARRAMRGLGNCATASTSARRSPMRLGRCSSRCWTSSSGISRSRRVRFSHQRA